MQIVVRAKDATPSDNQLVRESVSARCLTHRHVSVGLVVAWLHLQPINPRRDLQIRKGEAGNHDSGYDGKEGNEIHAYHSITDLKCRTWEKQADGNAQHFSRIDFILRRHHQARWVRLV